ncbi:MAG: YggS family pyridoxal phosphate-dependent enzyme [Bacillota bacterium]
MEHILENVEEIANNIAEICAKCGRNPQEIEVMGASKMNPIEPIIFLKNNGYVTTFGENRVQELLSKYDSNIVWDMIGQLQTNKVKYIVDKVRIIQSLDRQQLAMEIDKQAKKINKVQKVLIEINTGAEYAKGGLTFEEVLPFAETLVNYPNIKLVGVMAVAPICASEDDLRALFNKVHDIFVEMQGLYSDITVLSMGMSGDYKIAIECGSNLIRVGRTLFGARDYSK